MAPEVLSSECQCNNISDSNIMFSSQLSKSPLIEHNCESYDFKADIWSLGVTLYELLASDKESRFPFYGNSKTEIKKNIKTAQYLINQKKLNLSPYCIDFISHCLQYNSENRASATQLLNHPFLSVEYRLQKSHFKANHSESSFNDLYPINKDGNIEMNSKQKKFLIDLHSSSDEESNSNYGQSNMELEFSYIQG